MTPGRRLANADGRTAGTPAGVRCRSGGTRSAPSSARPTAASQRSHRCNARQLRHASTRARPGDVRARTRRAGQGSRSRSISGDVTSERFHGSSSDRSTTSTIGQPARSRDRGGCTDADRAGAVDHGGRASGMVTPARAARRRAGTVRRARRGRATSVSVPPAAPRRARRARTAAASPAHGAHAADRRPITTSTPARAAAQSSGIVATVSPARAQPDGEQRDLALSRRRRRARSPTDAGRTRPPTTASASRRRAAGDGARPRRRPQQRRSSMPVVAGDVGPWTGRSCERDAERVPVTARSGDAVTRNGRMRPAAQRTDAHSARSMISALGPAPVTFAIGFRRSTGSTAAVSSDRGRATQPPTRRPCEVDTHERADLAPALRDVRERGSRTPCRDPSRRAGLERSTRSRPSVVRRLGLRRRRRA